MALKLSKIRTNGGEQGIVFRVKGAHLRKLTFVLVAAFTTLLIAAALLTPPVWQLTSPSILVQRYDAQGQPSATDERGPGTPSWTNTRMIPWKLKGLLRIAEDWYFLEHHGISLGSMRKAWKRNRQAGKIVSGGSTLTQQLVKNAFLSPERSYVRKLRDILGALLVEKLLTKDEITTWYLNIVAFAPAVYGLQAASQHYFDKSPEQLSAQEASFLVLVLPHPRKYEPQVSRRPMDKDFTTRYVMLQWHGLRQGVLTKDEYVEALAIVPGGKAYGELFRAKPGIAIDSPLWKLRELAEAEKEKSH